MDMPNITVQSIEVSNGRVEKSAMFGYGYVKSKNTDK
jgi:hypothetical protein